MKIIHEITLDVSRQGVQCTVPITQHDAGIHELIVHLRNGAKPIKFFAGDEATLYLGTDSFEPVTVYTENSAYPNTLVYTLSPFASQTEGEVRAVFQIYKGSERGCYTPEIAFSVKKDTTSGSKVFESSPFSAVIKAQATAEAAASRAEEAAEAAESAAKEATNVIGSAKGDSAFIRYSANADGTDFTEERSEGQDYIGFATGQTAPTDKSDYTWGYIGESSAGSSGRFVLFSFDGGEIDMSAALVKYGDKGVQILNGQSVLFDASEYEDVSEILIIVVDGSLNALGGEAYLYDKNGEQLDGAYEISANVDGETLCVDNLQDVYSVFIKCTETGDSSGSSDTSRRVLFTFNAGKSAATQCELIFGGESSHTLTIENGQTLVWDLTDMLNGDYETEMSVTITDGDGTLYKGEVQLFDSNGSTLSTESFEAESGALVSLNSIANASVVYIKVKELHTVTVTLRSDYGLGYIAYVETNDGKTYSNNCDEGNTFTLSVEDGDSLYFYTNGGSGVLLTDLTTDEILCNYETQYTLCIDGDMTLEMYASS
ncbi:MAG: hypothetical protein IJ002_03180 [Clostridia bacterium]|nr:hypothetical protein [Clostridia bacterium]MBQ8836495.1 hypothetical protein [Clostridia bacterium]